MLRRAWWKKDKLTKYQNRHVREIVKYAYENVPFYHEVFRKHCIKPDDVKGVDDLRKLPVLSREDVQNNALQMISKKFDVSRLKRVVTSGSSGEPVTVYLSSGEDEFRKARHLRANIALGQKPRDRWIVITGPQHFSESTGFQKLLGLYVARPVSVFEDERVKVSTIQRLKPDVLDGYSSSLFLLAKEAEKRNAADIKPRIIIGGAELIDDFQKRFVEKVFDAPFYDQYACSELERLAWQCKERSSYHIDADSVVMEFIDENGENVAPGERGEIVCTSLFNYAMPLIRYAVGDVGVASNDVCSCGRSLPLMKLLEGRKDSFIVLPDGRVIAPHVLCLFMEKFKFFDNVEHYRIIQRRIDFIEFLVRMKGDFAEEAVKEELASHFRKALGVTSKNLTFETRLVDAIPLDKSGKLTSVLSEVSW